VKTNDGNKLTHFSLHRACHVAPQHRDGIVAIVAVTITAICAWPEIYQFQPNLENG